MISPYVDDIYLMSDCTVRAFCHSRTLFDSSSVQKNPGLSRTATGLNLEKGGDVILWKYFRVSSHGLGSVHCMNTK